MSEETRATLEAVNEAVTEREIHAPCPNLGEVVNKAAKHLPPGYGIQLVLTRREYNVALCKPDGVYERFYADGIVGEINEAICRANGYQARTRSATAGTPAHPERSLRGDYEKLKRAAECIRHWHDSGHDGMVVSADHVRALWAVLDEIQ